MLGCQPGQVDFSLLVRYGSSPVGVTPKYCNVFPVSNLLHVNQIACLKLLFHRERRGENLVNSCISKIHRYLKYSVKFIVIYNTKKVSYLLFQFHYKDKIPELSRGKVVYQVTCPGCNKTLLPSKTSFRTRNFATSLFTLLSILHHGYILLHSVHVKSFLSCR